MKAAPLCALATAFQLRLMWMASGQGNLQANLDWAIRAAWHASDWPGYRSRLLGIGLVELLGGDIRAFLIVIAAGIFIASLLSWRLAGLTGLSVFHAVYPFLANPYLTTWDIFEPAIFLAFAILVAERKSQIWFIGLFSIAIFNLQTAMWIPLWMMLSRRMVATGLVCAVVGVAIMYYFQHTGTPQLGLGKFTCSDATCYQNDYAQERIGENLHKLMINPMTLGLVGLIGFAAVYDQTALGLTFLTLLLATVALGVIDEYRIYLPFTALLVLGGRKWQTT